MSTMLSSDTTFSMEMYPFGHCPEGNGDISSTDGGLCTRVLRIFKEQSPDEVYDCIRGGSRNSRGKRLTISMVEEAWLSEKEERKDVSSKRKMFLSKRKNVSSKRKNVSSKRKNVFVEERRMFSSKRKNVMSKRKNDFIEEKIRFFRRERMFRRRERMFFVEERRMFFVEEKECSVKEKKESILTHVVKRLE
ncbi:hypothetical protein Tco_1474131 [Tanacetum coccineum]